VARAGVVTLCLGDHTVLLAELGRSPRFAVPSDDPADSHHDLWDEYFGQKAHGSVVRHTVEEG
jgi:arginase family enzyme